MIGMESIYFHDSFYNLLNYHIIYKHFRMHIKDILK